MSINAVSSTQGTRAWLTNSRHARILHVFDRVCNLINESREVLSIVSRRIGNGPFNLVIEGDVFFSDHLDAESLISIRADQLHLGDLTINTADAQLWSARPDWESLHTNKDSILNQLASLPFTNYQKHGLDTPFAKTAQGYSTTTNVQSLISNLSSALANADIPTVLTLTSQLAGLGAGLTPAGDDFLFGSMLAAWIIHPPEIARVLSEEITHTAVPLTTSLSAAWLKSAGRGESGILWHEFFGALISTDPMSVQESMDKILSVGETSGADALAGFIGTLTCKAESTSSKIL